MGWKIYFWIFTFLLIVDEIGVFSKKGASLIVIFDILISFMSLVGLFCFAYKKKWLRASFWKVYFYIFLVWDLSFNLIIGPYMGSDYSLISALIGLGISVPLYIGLYLYAFKFLEK
jgi:hypothetical protein